MKYKIAVWGLGGAYARLLPSLLRQVERGEIEVVGVIDKAFQGITSLDGYRLCDAHELPDLDFDYLLISSHRFFDEIAAEAMGEYGVQREKIVPGRVFFIPGFEFGLYARVKESRISIVSNNCWGGVVSNALGLQGLSPFKNAYMRRPDYLRLLADIRRYCETCELEYVRDDVDARGVQHPVMRLGDVEIHFNHDTDHDKIRSDWARRLARMNWNNMLASFYTNNPDFEQRFNAIEGLATKVCFVPYASEYLHSVSLPMKPGHIDQFETVLESAQLNCGFYGINLLQLLLGESGASRLTLSGGLAS